ncbi:hypothetical protein [Corynebacterium sp.]|uniref:hypothetical protein n=1 Tax=Corynebacterium sp. TaxID=1720 RepID=UPI0026391D5C|nr:hypothetical protein [Corynebacterium sp.]
MSLKNAAKRLAAAAATILAATSLTLGTGQPIAAAGQQRLQWLERIQSFQRVEWFQRLQR